MSEQEKKVMEARAIARYVRIAPRKVRLVVDQIRGKNIAEARTILAFSERSAAETVAKVLNSAVANAEHNYGMRADNLVVKATYVDEGPTLKRIRPRAQGRAFHVLKRTSHVTVVLKEKE